MAPLWKPSSCILYAMKNKCQQVAWIGSYYGWNAMRYKADWFINTNRFFKKKMEKTAISVNLCEEKYFLINCVEERIWGF